MLRRLSAVLLCRIGESVPVTALADALWEGVPPRTAHKTLQVYVRRLRQAIGDERIVHEAGAYAVAATAWEVDAGRFADLVRDGRAARGRADLESAAMTFERALGLWRGPAYAGMEKILYVAEEVRRLEEQRLLTYEELVAVNLELGRHGEVVADLANVTQAHPYRERLRAYLMIALYRTGRQAESLEVYRATRAALQEGLGVEPGPMLRSVHEGVLRDEDRFASLLLERAPISQHRRRPLPLNPERSADAPRAARTHERPVPVPRLLPAGVADFTGRDAEVSTLGRLLTRRRHPAAITVATVVGRAGVGKTALAVHTAHRLARAFPDGQLYVDLHGMDAQPANPSEVLGRFLLALDMDGRALPEGLERRTGLYRAGLAGRRILVVLDNAADEQQVRPLLPGSPSCAVLITSRRELPALGARTLKLDGLDPASARMLLLRIAGPERVEAEPAVATDIVRLCDHLPLAVRIAGARLAAREHWSLRHLADRLRQERRRLDELAAGDLSVRASLGASYGNLESGARRAFRLLGLLDAPSFAEWLPAALLTVPGGEAETHIEALIDAQLLICEGTDPNGQLRYRFHDLVRLYARERAEEEDGDQRRTALTRALSGWLALAEAADHQLTERLASDIRGRAPRWSLNPDKIRALTADPLAWFDSERAALRACVSQAAAAGLDELAWELASCTASYYAFRGLYEDWSGTHQTALQACTSSANRRGVAVMLRNLGCLRMTGIETSAGVLARRADTAVGIFRELGELRGEVDGLVLHSFALQHTGHLDQALACRDAAMGLAQLTGYELGKCRLWYLHAVVDRHQGNYEQAAAAAQRCLRMAKRVGTAHDRVLALWELTAACRDRDAFRATGQDLHEGLELCRRRGERLLEAYLLLARAGLYLRFGQDGARASVEQALAVFGEHRVLYGQAVGLRLLGEVEHGEERPAHALVSLTQAVEATRKLRDGYEHALALKALGAVYRTCGDDQAAGRAWAEARRLFTRLGTATATRAFPVAPSNTLPGMTSRR